MRRLLCLLAPIPLVACDLRPPDTEGEQRFRAAERALKDGEAKKTTLDAAITAATAARHRARYDLARTLAAMGAIAERQPGTFAVDETIRLASAGFALESMSKEARAAAIEDSVAGILRARAHEQCERDNEGPDVDVDECRQPIDHCREIERTIAVDPAWHCTHLLKYSDDVPAAVFCTSPVEYPAPDPKIGARSPLAEAGQRTVRDVIRTAVYAHGRLHVSDFPGRKDGAFTIDHVDGLRDCAKENQYEACRAACDKKLGRKSGCDEDLGLDRERRAPPEPERENDTDELRSAKEALFEAQQDLANAKEHLASAKSDLAYAICAAPCETSDDGVEEVPEKPAVTAQIRFLDSPASGYYLVNRVYSTGQREIALLFDRTLERFIAQGRDARRETVGLEPIAVIGDRAPRVCALDDAARHALEASKSRAAQTVLAACAGGGK